MDVFYIFDTQLFFLINHLPHVWWSDMVGQMLSGFENAWILWLVIGGILFIREERKDHWFIVSSSILGILTYVFSEALLKHLVTRMRPDVLAGAIVVGMPPDSFSFPSTHATLAFACAYLFSDKEPRWRWGFYALAVCVCFSRIYLGHHYPLDVCYGGLLGYAIGVISMGMTRKFRSLTKKKKV